ncbi:MAG: hypothetical protein QM714_05800 [Nocardioides sp.]|uniref:hypothetical protein n=1 Tax=Nocardioides sp. TaxID=35761 RepID=UPI0039E5E4DD
MSSTTHAVHGAAHDGAATVRVRHLAKEAAAVMVVSAATSGGLALTFLVLTSLGR